MTNAQKEATGAVALNQLLLYTFGWSVVCWCLMYAIDSDMRSIDGGTVIFMLLFSLVSLIVSFTAYKLRLRFYLSSYPAILSNVISFLILVVFLYSMLHRHDG